MVLPVWLDPGRWSSSAQLERAQQRLDREGEARLLRGLWPTIFHCGAAFACGLLALAPESEADIPDSVRAVLLLCASAFLVIGGLNLWHVLSPVVVDRTGIRMDGDVIPWPAVQAIETRDHPMLEYEEQVVLLVATVDGVRKVDLPLSMEARQAASWLHSLRSEFPPTVTPLPQLNLARAWLGRVSSTAALLFCATPLVSFVILLLMGVVEI